MFTKIVNSELSESYKAGRCQQRGESLGHWDSFEALFAVGEISRVGLLILPKLLERQRVLLA